LEVADWGDLLEREELELVDEAGLRSILKIALKRPMLGVFEFLVAAVVGDMGPFWRTLEDGIGETSE
jgi:hypothetical protein